MDWREYITVDPAVCHRQACVRGIRIPASVVLDNLAAGLPVEELIRSYPTLSREGIRASVAYATEWARERLVTLG